MCDAAYSSHTPCQLCYEVACLCQLAEGQLVRHVVLATWRWQYLSACYMAMDERQCGSTIKCLSFT